MRCSGKKTACLIGQRRKMIKFICKKISDWMELSQPAFTIPSQLGRLDRPLPYNPKRDGKSWYWLAHILEFHRRKNKHGNSKVNMSKSVETNRFSD